MTPPLPPPHPQFGAEPPKTDALATAAFVLGLLAVFCLGPLAGLPAIICAFVAGGRIRKANGALGGSGLLLAGAVLGAFGSLLWIVGGIVAVRWTKQAAQQAKGMFGEFTNAAQFAMLEVSLQTYRAKEGHWPGAEGKTDAEVDTAAVLDALNAQRGADQKPGTLEALPNLVKNGRLVDRWGNLLHVAYDLDGDGKVLLGERTVREGPVAIWSDGPNAQNEWGEGDDLTSW